METQIILQGTTEKSLVKLINENVKAQLLELKKDLLNKELNENLLSRKQACDLLQIDSSTLYHWTNKGKVTAYGIANRRYYKRDEIMASLIELKTKGGEK